MARRQKSGLEAAISAAFEYLKSALAENLIFFSVGKMTNEGQMAFSRRLQVAGFLRAEVKLSC